jgi:sarcosine oxidase / L-pipecolate oxidase
MPGTNTPPQHILLIGAGEFGLATTLALLRRPSFNQTTTRITLLDASPDLPNIHGSSVDASRIIRPDYANPVYAKLAADAQRLWRDKSVEGWGGEGRYTESGFLLAADCDSTSRKLREEGKVQDGVVPDGERYVVKSLKVVRRLMAENGVEEQGLGEGREGKKGVQEIKGGEGEMRKAAGLSTEGRVGDWGYVNWNSGWADAEAVVRFALRKVKKEDGEGGGRVSIRTGAKVKRLLSGKEREGSSRVVGVELEGEGGGEKIFADLVVVSAGAWSPSLVDLQGRAVATGQVLSYLEITDEERDRLKDNPTVINLSQGMFIIPPSGNELKIARHGFGYRHMESVREGDVLVDEDDLDPAGVESSEGRSLRISVPVVGIAAPLEGQQACRAALKQMLPEMGDRPFTKTRICWYCDTPDGDFLIDWHPKHKGLFLATGGSGHGFKFFPVIGERIVDALEGKLDSELKRAWSWRKERVENFHSCEDGSRAGPRRMDLEEELAKGDAGGDRDA